jgi:GT2 family glycosyltransferase
MKVTYMIATRNRREELLKTLAACRDQEYAAKEIVVVDDGSSDGTYEAVRTQFPEVQIHRNERNRGSVASRNQIFDRASGDILIGFDDDSRFVDRGATQRVVERFRSEPDLGLMEFQDIGPEYPERIAADSPGRLRGERHIAAFGEGRYAVRRAAIEKAGTFPEFFWHAYEGPDLALRIWDAGYRCLAWYDIVVWHEFSDVNRDKRRTHYLHARNELLSCIMRAPLAMLLPLAAWRMVSQLRNSLSRGWWTIEMKVWWDALRLMPVAWRNRRPVRMETLRRCFLLNGQAIRDPIQVWDLGRARSNRSGINLAVRGLKKGTGTSQ